MLNEKTDQSEDRKEEKFIAAVISPFVPIFISRLSDIEIIRFVVRKHCRGSACFVYPFYTSQQDIAKLDLSISTSASTPTRISSSPFLAESDLNLINLLESSGEGRKLYVECIRRRKKGKERKKGST